MYDDDEVDIDVDPYDDSFDFVDSTADKMARERKASMINPREIDYNIANPDEIDNADDALEIILYLRDLDKGMMEEEYYRFLLDKFGWEESDPTELTNEEAFIVASDFKLFAQYMFLCEYGFKFQTNWHHDLLCSVMQDLFLGKLRTPRVIINMPPRYSKTQLLIYFVAWSIGLQQDSEFIWISYSNLLSEESSGKIRSVLMNEKYQRIFPLELDMSSKAKNNFATSKKGKVYATSTGGTLTGKGAGKFRKSFGGCIVVDDGNNTLDAFSDTNRNKANDWVANTLLSRRNNMEHTPIIVIAQRIHANDISGFLLPSEEKPRGGAGEDFLHIEIPAMLTLEHMEKLGVPHDSSSYLKGDREKNEYPLWPEKISLAKLRAMRETLPPLTYYGQYQQQPFVGDGSTIKASWFRQVEPPAREDIVRRVFVLDTAQTKTSRSDYNVLIVACILKDGTAYIEDLFRQRMESPDMVEVVLNYYRMYRPLDIYIEYKSSGINLIQYLRRESMPLPLVPIPRNAAAGDGDKICRANGAAPYIKAGYVTVKKDAEWLPTFFHEVMTFPTGLYDDQIDTVIDLVSMCIVKDDSFLYDVVVDQLPLKGHTYGEEIQALQNAVDPLSTNLDVDLTGLMDVINYRGKPVKDDVVDEWVLGF